MTFSRSASHTRSAVCRAHRVEYFIRIYLPRDQCRVLALLFGRAPTRWLAARYKLFKIFIANVHTNDIKL